MTVDTRASTVLVVDDDAAMRTTVAEVLAAHAYRAIPGIPRRTLYRRLDE